VCGNPPRRPPTARWRLAAPRGDASVSEGPIARRALELADDPEVDVELAAGDLLEQSDADQDALATAADELDRRLAGDPEDAVTRRARSIVTAAADVGYGGE
jgi:hypothetical protein